jgi:hypothetical protein
MSIFLDIIAPGKTTVIATAPGNQIYEPFATELEINTVATVNIATGDLKITDSFEVLGNAYIPSGYTNFPFLPVLDDADPGSSQAFTRTWLNSAGTPETAFPTANSTGTKGFFRFNPLNSGQLNRYLQTEKFILYTGNSLNPFLVPHQDFRSNTTGVVTSFSFATGPQFLQGRLELYEIEERFEHIERSGVFCILPNQKMGFGTYTPQEKMDIEGNLRIDGGYINPITGNNVVFNITGILV